MPDLHPGPHATFSQPNSVTARDAWEAENPDWRSKIGQRDDIIPQPIKSLPDLPRTEPPVTSPERTREEFIAWAVSEERLEEIKELTLGSIWDTYQQMMRNLEDLLDETAQEDQDRRADLNEKVATVNHRLKVTLDLIHQLRFGWGIDLAKV